MATVKQVISNHTALTTTALDSLASATYVLAGTITHNTNQPLDVLVEIAVTPGTVSGNKQALVFAKISRDGSTFSSGPQSGNSATDEPDLYFVGALPLNTNGTQQTKTFSLASALGGVLPYSTRIIVKNDSGSAFAASGSSVSFSEVSMTVN